MSGRRNEALHRNVTQLRLAGATFDEIGKAVGVSMQRAHRIFQSDLEKHVSPIVEQVRADADQRIVALIARFWRGAAQGDRDDAGLVQRLLDQRLKLHGGYAPEKVELTVDVVEAWIARMESEAAALERRAGANGSAAAQDAASVAIPPRPLPVGNGSSGLDPVVEGDRDP